MGFPIKRILVCTNSVLAITKNLNIFFIFEIKKYKNTNYWNDIIRNFISQKRKYFNFAKCIE